MDFLHQEEDEILPILAGYFNKIVQSLLAKMKSTTLEYLLIVKRGSIFEVLLKNMHHYSLAVLLIELLEVDIKPNEKVDKPRMAWEQSEESDDQKILKFSKMQIRQKAVLAEKGAIVANTLISWLSNLNQDDFERTLNASHILNEFCNNDQCFSILTSDEVLPKLIAVACQG